MAPKYKTKTQKELFKHLGRFIRCLEKDSRFDENSRVYFEVENVKFVNILSRLSLDIGIVKKEDNFVFGAKVV